MSASAVSVPVSCLFDSQWKRQRAPARSSGDTVGCEGQKLPFHVPCLPPRVAEINEPECVLLYLSSFHVPPCLPFEVVKLLPRPSVEIVSEKAWQQLALELARHKERPAKYFWKVGGRLVYVQPMSLPVKTSPIFFAFQIFIRELVKNLFNEGNDSYRECDWEGSMNHYSEALNIADYANSEGIHIPDDILEKLRVNRIACYSKKVCPTWKGWLSDRFAAWRRAGSPLGEGSGRGAVL